MQEGMSFLLQGFKVKFEERGGRRVEVFERGVRSCFIVDGDPVRLGAKFHGIDVSLSSGICAQPWDAAQHIPYGPVPPDEVALRRMRMDVDIEVPIAVRLDTCWVQEEKLWRNVDWLLRCAVDARRAYERGALLAWTPMPQEEYAGVRS